MRGYSETDIFQAWELEALREARAVVEAIPDILPEVEASYPLRCHEVARVVGEVLGFPVLDGQFGAAEHSWVLLDLKDVPQRSINILDPYAVGSLPQVQLIDMGHPLPHVRNYQEGNLRTDVDKELVVLLIATVRKNLVTFPRHENASQGLERPGRTGMAPIPQGPRPLSG